MTLVTDGTTRAAMPSHDGIRVYFKKNIVYAQSPVTAFAKASAWQVGPGGVHRWVCCVKFLMRDTA